MLKHQKLIKLLATLWLPVLLGLVAISGLYADETEKRRVDISISIFPRIVAVDNQFRDKLDKEKKTLLLFVYDSDKDFAEDLAARMLSENNNIGGMLVDTRVMSVEEELSATEVPTAIFIVEKLDQVRLEKVMAYAASTHRLLFSPYIGDVERGVMVGVSVTNRVKPYFNVSALRNSEVVINALLMKMSKRHE